MPLISGSATAAVAKTHRKVWYHSSSGSGFDCFGFTANTWYQMQAPHDPLESELQYLSKKKGGRVSDVLLDAAHQTPTMRSLGVKSGRNKKKGWRMKQVIRCRRDG